MECLREQPTYQYKKSLIIFYMKNQFPVMPWLLVLILSKELEYEETTIYPEKDLKKQE